MDTAKADQPKSLGADTATDRTYEQLQPAHRDRPSLARSLEAPVDSCQRFWSRLVFDVVVVVGRKTRNVSGD